MESAVLYHTVPSRRHMLPSYQVGIGWFILLLYCGRADGVGSAVPHCALTQTHVAFIPGGYRLVYTVIVLW